MPAHAGVARGARLTRNESKRKQNARKRSGAEAAFLGRGKALEGAGGVRGGKYAREGRGAILGPSPRPQSAFAAVAPGQVLPASAAGPSGSRGRTASGRVCDGRNGRGGGVTGCHPRPFRRRRRSRDGAPPGATSAPLRLKRKQRALEKIKEKEKDKGERKRSPRARRAPPPRHFLFLSSTATRARARCSASRSRGRRQRHGAAADAGDAPGFLAARSKASARRCAPPSSPSASKGRPSPPAGRATGCHPLRETGRVGRVRFRLRPAKAREGRF